MENNVAKQEVEEIPQKTEKKEAKVINMVFVGHTKIMYGDVDFKKILSDLGIRSCPPMVGTDF